MSEPEYDSLRAEINCLRAAIERHGANACMKYAQGLQVEIDRLHAEVERLNSDITFQQARCIDKDAEIDRLRTDNKMLTDALLAKDGKNFDDACKEIDRLRAELAAHKLDCDGCLDERMRLRAENAELREAHDRPRESRRDLG